VDVNEKRVSEGKAPVKGAAPEILEVISPSKVSAMVAWLAHEQCQSEAKVFEAGAGYFAQLNWARSAPLFATAREGREIPLPEDIRDGQETLSDFDAGDMPVSGDGAMGAPNALQWVFRHLKS
jgi:hypothetical protein